MTCQEVVDYMNRYLDGDLDEHERMLLMEHLKQCPDDQELFERLKQLSGELEELPKVSPPFSLVDSILPQLAEIDEHREAKAAALASLEAIDEEEAAAADREEQELPARSRRSGTVPNTRFNKRFRIWTGSLAAVAAAAVILVLAPWGTDIRQQLALDGGATTKTAQNSGTATSEMMENQQELRSMNDNFDALDGNKVHTSTESNQTNEEFDVELRRNPSSYPTGGGEGSTTYPDPDGNPVQKNGMMPGFSGPSLDKSDQRGESSGLLPLIAASPNDEYSYSINNAWVVIQKKDGSKQFDHTFEGSVSNPVWSSDSRELTVTVLAGDGSEIHYKIDAAKGSFEQSKTR